MKAILVIDMPKSCSECPLFNDITGGCDVALVEDYNCNIIRKCCPLKPMPKKKPTLNTYVVEDMKKQIVDIHSVGWNDCIDEILGEEE